MNKRKMTMDILRLKQRPCKMVCILAIMLAWNNTATYGRLLPTQFKSQNFRQIEQNSELSNMAVMDITQDSKGFIWIATLKGLNKYDGNSIEQYFESPGKIQSNSIMSLLPADNGLWIGTENGLCRYDSCTGKFFAIDSLETGEVSCIRHIGERFTGFGTRKGLFIHDKESGKTEKADSVPIMKFTTDKYDNIWAIGEMHE